MRLYLKNIICATDFSDLSNHTVSYGISLAKEFKSKLFLCHVIDLSSATMYGEATFAFEAQYVHMEEYANERVKRLMAGHDVDWEPCISTGRAADEIVRIAEEKDADLIITATRGRSGLKRLILGSVTENLMRTAPCPLLTVRKSEEETSTTVEGTISLNRILVGCDFSPDSNLAFEYALSLAQEFQSALHLVHVVEPPVYKDLIKTFQDERGKMGEDVRRQLNEKLENMVPQEARNWCKPKTSLLAGSPHEELSKYAVVQNIDLLVVGVRGHKLVERFFVGSTTDRIIRKAPCDVLSVRPITKEDQD